MYSILVTRPEPAASKLAEKLRQDGFRPYLAPMTEYIAVAADIPDTASFQALVFSSAEAVRVFSERSTERKLPVLTVGEATADTARKAGFTRIFSAQGNSEDIMGLIRSHAKKLSLKKILHPCSADTPDDIERMSSKSGVKVLRLPLYEARLIENIPPDAGQALHRGAIDAVTLFSARTARNFIALLEREGLRGTAAKMDFICISNRVAAALDTSLCHSIHIARRPDMEAMQDILKNRAELRSALIEERRKRQERRVQQAPYAGMERRTGAERRAHEMRQQHIIMKEKMSFLNRSALTFAFVFFAIVVAGTFVMAPEYLYLEEMGKFRSSLEKRMKAIGYTEPVPVKKIPFSGRLNRQIEKIGDTGNDIQDVTGRIVFSAAEALRTRLTDKFSQMFDNVAALRSVPGGDEALDKSLQTLRHLLAASPDNPDTLNQAVDIARRRDENLNSVLGNIGRKDLAAAALLLTLNEFRSNISKSRPYAEDLALLKKFAGNDPEMNKSLRRLAPYAERGVMSREMLQKEFRGLAANIITAKLAGKDVSVQEEALGRFNKLTEAGQSASTVKGQDTEAAVARTQLMLDQGDIKGALRELRALDEKAAEQAMPWVNSASEKVTADQSSEDLTQSFLQALSGNAVSAGDGNFSIERLVTSIRDKLMPSSSPYSSGTAPDNMGVLAPPVP